MLPSLGERVKRWQINILVGLVLMLVSDEHIFMRSLAVSTSGEVTTLPLHSYRLPRSVRPLHYDLELQPFINFTDPSNFTFRGSVKILVICDSATDKITLHVKNLIVDNTSIMINPETRSGTGDPMYVSYEVDTERQFFIITLNKNMEVGKNYSIQMNFTSPLGESQQGWYYVKSERDSGNVVYTATTQLEMIHARKVFPCFDEPAMKATFNITIVRQTDRISLSNMEIIITSNSFEYNGTTYVKDVYSQTPLMSTYLLAFVVCDFQYLEAKSKDNVTVNLVAVNDLLSVAMENWGISIYKDTYILYTKGVTLHKKYDQIAKTVAHELIHMWVGNLVTQEWWSDTWLKESFTVYFEILAIEATHPERRPEEYFVVDKMHDGFDTDSEINDPIIFQEVNTPAELGAFSHGVLYSKGPSIVRMLEFVLGETLFRNAYRKFLKKRMYSTANRDQFYMDMEEETKRAGMDIKIKDFMDPFIIQRNYPVVTVVQYRHNTNLLRFKQERFLKFPATRRTDTSTTPFNYQWTIPLTVASSKDRRFNLSGNDIYWLYKEEKSKKIHMRTPLPSCADNTSWILVNVQQKGYYRVNYLVNNWLALSRQLKINHSVIPVINRAQIINDAWTLANANYTTMRVALANLEYLHNELDHAPWHAAETEINTLNSNLESTPLSAPFRKFMQDKLTAPFQHYGLVNATTNHMDKFTQILLAKMACDFGVRVCLDQVKIVYNSYMSGQSIDPDVKDTIVCHVIASGGVPEWEDALLSYRNANDDHERIHLIMNMACTTDTQIINRFLNLIFDENGTFQTWEALYVVYRLINREEGKDITWNFLKNNFERLVNKTAYFGCDSYLSSITAGFNREDNIAELKAFLTQHCPSYDQAALESKFLAPIRAKIAWVKTHSPTIKNWLIKNGQTIN